VLIPGVVIGALLGWAEHRRRLGHRRGQRSLVFVPLLFPVAALSLPGAITTLLTTGQGSGAIGLVLFGMLGGIALAGRGRPWVRLVCGVVAFSLVPLAFLGPPFRPELDPSTPLGAWVATLFSALYLVLVVACAVPRGRRRPVNGGVGA
jgi:hypothetical protein